MGFWGVEFERYHYFPLVVIFYVMSICFRYLSQQHCFAKSLLHSSSYFILYTMKKNQRKTDTFHGFMVMWLELIYIM